MTDAHSHRFTQTFSLNAFSLRTRSYSAYLRSLVLKTAGVVMEIEEASPTLKF